MRLSALIFTFLYDAIIIFYFDKNKPRKVVVKVLTQQNKTRPAILISPKKEHVTAQVRRSPPAKYACGLRYPAFISLRRRQRVRRYLLIITKTNREYPRAVFLLVIGFANISHFQQFESVSLELITKQSRWCIFTNVSSAL